MSAQNEMDMRAEWRERKARDAKENARVRAGQTIKLAQDAEGLTGLPEWDWLVRHIGQKIEERQSVLNDTIRAFASKRGLEATELTDLRERALCYDSELRVFMYIRNLPAELVANGLESRKSLKGQEKSP